MKGIKKLKAALSIAAPALYKLSTWRLSLRKQTSRRALLCLFQSNEVVHPCTRVQPLNVTGWSWYVGRSDLSGLGTALRSMRLGGMADCDSLTDAIVLVHVAGYSKPVAPPVAVSASSIEPTQALLAI